MSDPLQLVVFDNTILPGSEVNKNKNEHSLLHFIDTYSFMFNSRDLFSRKLHHQVLI